MIDIRDASLIDFLPESIASDPEIIAISLAIDPELRSVGAAIIEATILPRIASVDEAVLEELAWAFRLNRLQVWDVASAAGKRAVLTNIFELRKKSGTRFAVRRALDLIGAVAVGVEHEIIEWFEEGAAAYTYRVRFTVADEGLTLFQQQAAAELTHRFEPTRAELSEMAWQRNSDIDPLWMYPATSAGWFVELETE